MIGQLATDRYGPVLARSSATQLEDFLADVGSASLTPGEVLWEEIPLTATVTEAAADRARVRVWSVLVLGAPGVGVPRQVWRTVTVTLEWEHDDWRIDGWSDEPGPTPTVTDAADTATVDDLRDVTSWPTATEGGDV